MASNNSTVLDSEFIKSIYDVLKQNHYTVIGLYFIIFTVALLSNIVVIVVILKDKIMRSVTNYFLVNLAIAYLLAPLVCMPNAAWHAFTLLYYFGGFWCKILPYMQCLAMLFTYSTMGRALCSVMPAFENGHIRNSKRYHVLNSMNYTNSLNISPGILKEAKLYTLLLGHSNSALNPIIYCVLSRKFRTSVKSIFVCDSTDKQSMGQESSGSAIQMHMKIIKNMPAIPKKLNVVTSRLLLSQKTTKTCVV